MKSRNECLVTLPGIKAFAIILFHAFLGLSHTFFFATECSLLFTGETADSALTFIPLTGVTQKTINVPVDNSCTFYFGEKFYAHYIGCDGAWREIPPKGVNEGLEVTPGWNKNQLQFKV